MGFRVVKAFGRIFTWIGLSGLGEKLVRKSDTAFAAQQQFDSMVGNLMQQQHLSEKEARAQAKELQGRVGKTSPELKKRMSETDLKTRAEQGVRESMGTGQAKKPKTQEEAPKMDSKALDALKAKRQAMRLPKSPIEEEETDEKK